MWLLVVGERTIIELIIVRVSGHEIYMVMSFVLIEGHVTTNFPYWYIFSGRTLVVHVVIKNGGVVVFQVIYFSDMYVMATNVTIVGVIA